MLMLACLTLLFLTCSNASGEGTVKMSKAKLISKSLGDKCSSKYDGAVATCIVRRGEEVTLQATLDVKSKCLKCSIQFTNEKASISGVSTCLDNEKKLAFNSQCNSPAVPLGSYQLQPITFTAPNPQFPASKTMKVMCTGSWSDGSTTTDQLAGSISVTLQ